MVTQKKPWEEKGNMEIIQQVCYEGVHPPFPRDTHPVIQSILVVISSHGLLCRDAFNTALQQGFTLMK